MELKNNRLFARFSNTSELNKTILRHSFWILLGTLLSKFLLLLATVLITDYVDKRVYGEVGIIKSTITMFSVFAGLGLGVTATKFISQYKNIDKLKTSNIIGLSNLFSIVMSLLVLLLFFLFSKYLALQINAPHLSEQLKIAGVILFFSALNGIQTGILDGFEKFKALSVNNIIAAVFSAIFQIIGAKIYGINGIIVGLGLHYIILYFLNYVSIYRVTKKDYNFSIFNKSNFKEYKLIWIFSVPAVLSGLMVSPVVWITNNFLVNQINGYEEMANFDIASQWRGTILFIPTALCQIALPMLSAAINKNDYNKILKKNIILNFVISLIVVLIVLAFIPYILKMYGKNYADANIPMIILMITTILIAVNNVIGQAIASLNKMWLAFYVNLIWGISLIVFSSVFVIKYDLGAIGLSVSYLLSYIVHSICQYFILLKISKI